MDDDEKRCVNVTYPAVIKELSYSKYSDPCKNSTNQCVKFCKNLKIIQKHLQGSGQLKKLLTYMSHPTGFQYSSSPVVPFCYQGSEVNSFETKFVEAYNGSASSYGYKFCTNVQQRWTDAGLCSTIQYPKVMKKKTVYKLVNNKY